jgi:DMSO/TMAO reductase YedYZ molybdopterin-dependent catalytic subunit
MMSVARPVLAAILILIASAYPASIVTAEDTVAVAVAGHVRHPQHFDLAALRKLPPQRVEVSFQGERGVTQANFTGVPLWALLDEAGGLVDADKGAELRHTVKVTAKDGYLVVLSTGEIAPEFGAKPAILAYQRNDEPAGQSGLRLVMPGDKRGGRNVRDVVTIDVE